MPKSYYIEKHTRWYGWVRIGGPADKKMASSAAANFRKHNPGVKVRIRYHGSKPWFQ